MLTTISKTFDFDAAHRLDRLPAEHKCHRMHGHTYRVEIRLRGEPGRRLGMLIDYAEIAKAWAPLHAQLDHQTLNDVPGLEVPTTEVLAEWLYERLVDRFSGLSLAIRVFESSTTYAEVGRT